jgi:hypothetical protein
MLPALYLSLSGTQIDSGRIGSGFVSIPQTAESGGLSVSITSSSPDRITITSPTVVIPSGQSTVPFYFTAAIPGSTTISAIVPGLATAVISLTSALPVSSPDFFGLSVLDYVNVAPQLTYGTTRTWDAHPGLDWAEANPAQNQFNFAPLNAYIAVNANRNLQILYTFGRTPLWASTNPTATGSYGPGQCAAPILSAWDQYVTAVVTTAAGRIRYWELWNEPDQAGTWCSDIPTMVTMAQHAYKIIKSIDPTAQVLSPAATGGAGATWLNDFIVAGGKGTFDIVAFHGYEGAQAERITAIVDVYRLVLARYNLGALPLWDTECSWGAGGESTIGDNDHRAAFVSKYLVLQWSKAVDRVLWYAYDSEPEWGRLTDSEGNPAPPSIAFGETRTWLVGSTLTQPCAINGAGTYTCNISRSGGYTAQVLWNSTTDTSVTIPPGMTEYRDLSGTIHPIVGATVTATYFPILVESAPIPR